MFWPMSVPPAHWDGWDWNQPSGSLLKSLNVICVFRSSLSLLRDKPGAESSRLGRAESGLGTLLAEDMLIQTSALFSAACRLWEYTSSHQSSETSKTEASPLGSPHLSLSLSLPPQGEARIGGFPFAHSAWSQKGWSMPNACPLIQAVVFVLFVFRSGIPCYPGSDSDKRNKCLGQSPEQSTCWQ